MTTRSYRIGDTDHHYWVYETDSEGYEVPELENGPPEFVLPKFVSIVSNTENPVTDVVIVIHGWNTPQYDNEEIDFYGKFFEAFMKDYIDHPPQSGSLNPLLIGVHWPSAPGAGRADESIDDETTFAEDVARIKSLAKSLQETAPPDANRIEQILRQIRAAPVSQPERALEANVHNVENVGRSPAEDDSIAESSEEANGQDIRGLFRCGTRFVTSVVRRIDDSVTNGQVSCRLVRSGRRFVTTVVRQIDDTVFGQFERRSEAVGENGVHILLALLQECAPSTTRFHLICHSLGAAAVCRALVGRENSKYLLRKKVHSATILQGAIWSKSLGEGESMGA